MTLDLFTLLKNDLYASVLSPPVIGFNKGHLRGSLVSFWQSTERFQLIYILKHLLLHVHPPSHEILYSSMSFSYLNILFLAHENH